VNTRDAYVEKLKAQLDEWDAELDKLDATAVKAEGDAKIRYEEKIKELCQEHEEAQQRLTQIQSQVRIIKYSLGTNSRKL
jgi:uncharacterized protein YukE